MSQIAALFLPLLLDIGYRLRSSHVRQAEEVRGRVKGYTFFEDRNRNLRDVGRALGFPMGVHQHTFIVPFEPLTPSAAEGEEPSALPLERFFGGPAASSQTSLVSPTSSTSSTCSTTAAIGSCSRRARGSLGSP